MSATSFKLADCRSKTMAVRELESIGPSPQNCRCDRHGKGRRTAERSQSESLSSPPFKSYLSYWSARFNCTSGP